MQHENLKQNDLRGAGAKMNESEILRQQLGQLGLQINSPKYAGKDQKAILAEIMNKSNMQREFNIK